MARMTTEQAVSAIRAINAAITVEAIKAILMSCDKWTMVQVYEEIERRFWKKDVTHTLKANLAQNVAVDLRDAIERREFEAMTVQEKYTALTTRGYDYATRHVEVCTEREYDEIGLMLGVKFTRQHSPLHRWNMLLDAIEKFQKGENAPVIESVQDETPATEVVPAHEELNSQADKYLASEMTADELEAVMKEADAETLREFAVQREIPIDDNEDCAGIVKILMEELVCEKLGVYDTDPADKEICTELEEVEQEEQPTALVFEVGKTYFTHPPLGRISKDYTVISRTAKTILFRDEYGYTYRKKITNSKHTEALSIEGAFISARNITTRAEAITEPEQPAPVIEAVKEETPAPAKVWLQRKHSWSILDKVACVERTDLTAKFAAKMVRIIDEQMQQERIKDLHNLHGFQWEDRYHATSAEWVAANREKYRLELLRARYVERTYRVKELEELTAAEWSRLELEDLMELMRGISFEGLPEYMPEHERTRIEAELTRRREADRPFLDAVIRHEKWLETPEGKAKMHRARMLNYGE